MAETTYFALCLQRDLEPNLHNGWVEVRRTWQISCFDWQILLEWTKDGEPPPVEVSL